MSDKGLDLHRRGGERLAAWVLTGPLGHLVGFVTDVAVLWLAWVRGQARRRLARLTRTAAALGRRERGGAAAPPAPPSPTR